jgi:hypothetical protein
MVPSPPMAGDDSINRVLGESENSHFLVPSGLIAYRNPSLDPT